MTPLRALPWVAATGLLLAAVSLAPVRTAASWSMAPTVSGSVGTLASCSTTGTFDGAAQSRALAGTVLGSSVGALSQVAALSRSATSYGTTTSSGATSQGGGLYSSSSDLAGAASALDTATNSQVLSTAAGSTWYSTVSGATTGISAASSGAVDPTTGALLTSTGSSAGTLDISGAVGAGSSALTGLSGVSLAIGPAGAQVTFDGCRSVWGVSGALTRSYHVGSLRLGFVDSAAQTLDAAVTGQNSTLATRFSTLSGSSVTSPLGTTAGADLAKSLQDGLLSAGYASPTASAGSTTVTVSVPAAQTAQLSADLTEVAQDASAIVSLDTSTNTATADLKALTGALDGQAANTSILTAGRTTSLSTALQSALDTHIAHVQRDWEAERDAMTVRVQATATGTASLLGAPVSTSIDVTATAAAWAAGTETQVAPTTTAGLLASLLTPITNGIANAVGTDFYGGSSGMQTAIGTALTTPARAAITTAESNVTTARATEASAMPTEVGRLAGAVALTLNQQPDVAPLPTAYPGSLPDSITALRVVVTGTSGTVVDLDLANASAGPNRAFGAS